MNPLDNEFPMTELLGRYGRGDQDAGNELARAVYRTLHDRAIVLLQGEREAHSLRATGLVNEAWIRMGAKETEFENRKHFLRLAGRVMRNVLVDHARRRHAAKRNEDRKVDWRTTLHLSLSTDEEDQVEVLALHEALDQLGQIDKELAEVVELRFFGGLTFEEVAEALDKPTGSVHRDWQMARAWLVRALSDQKPAS